MKAESIDPNGSVRIPVMMHPLFRTQVAIDRGVERKLLFKTWGGLGDQICAEPTLRHAIKNYSKDCEIFLAAERPELFRHLEFSKVFDVNEAIPNYLNYLTFETITPPNDSNMVWLYFSHLLTHCVDFPSMCALRLQLPFREKEIHLSPPMPQDLLIRMVDTDNMIFVHPGRHWESKTFPKDWWDTVLACIKNRGGLPVIIGANTDDNRGTVDVDTEGCVDLRNKVSVMDMIWILQRARVLLTNDSAPLHMAASRDPNEETSGYCHIGFVATCKHPDYITHWRHGEFGFRMKNHGLGGMWSTFSTVPNKDEKVEVEKCSEELLRSWLPQPKDFATWACDRL